MRKITGIALVVWAIIATVLLLWSVASTAPWERQGRCLDALLRIQKIFDVPSLDVETKLRFLENATDDAKRWCG